MDMQFDELDQITRESMEDEFSAEQATISPYRSVLLTSAGQAAWPSLMLNAIRVGNEVSLGIALQNVAFWEPEETYIRSGIARQRAVNVVQAFGSTGVERV
jgi:hypothetical protein